MAALTHQINSAGNPPDKAAMRQERENYRKEQLDIGKDEANHLAELNKNATLLEEKQLAAAREDIKSNTEKRRRLATQLYGSGGAELSAEEQAELQAFIEEYSQNAGISPDMNNPQDQQFFMQWKQQRRQQQGKETEQVATVKPAQSEPASDSRTAQQLRDIYNQVVK